MDYLSQLLGRTDEKIQSFVQDVGRFHEGEPLISIEDVDDDVKLPPAAVTDRTCDTTKPPKASSSDRRNEATGRNSSMQTSKLVSLTKAVATNPPPKLASMPPTSGTAVKSSTRQSTAPRTVKEAMPPPVVSSLPPKSHPPKGKASIVCVCGCFGSVHKPLTNCLYCGRISCEKEGYDYCPFCGLLVEKVSGGYVLVSRELGFYKCDV